MNLEENLKKLKHFSFQQTHQTFGLNSKKQKALKILNSLSTLLENFITTVCKLFFLKN